MQIKIVSKEKIDENFDAEVAKLDDKPTQPELTHWKDCMYKIADTRVEVYKAFDESYNAVHPDGFMIGIPKTFVSMEIL